jgi:hypothetical protein
MNTTDWTTGKGIDAPKGALRAPSSGISLWRPQLVLADRARVSPSRRLVMPGEPGFRPEAVRAQVDAAQALLRSFTHAQQTLGAHAARAEARGQAATTDRERVFAAMETYRVKAELDDVIASTMRSMTALMEGPSVR